MEKLFGRTITALLLGAFFSQAGVVFAALDHVQLVIRTCS
jgi:hypothetical protein